MAEKTTFKQFIGEKTERAVEWIGDHREEIIYYSGIAGGIIVGAVYGRFFGILEGFNLGQEHAIDVVSRSRGNFLK